MLDLPRAFLPEMNMVYPPHQGNNPLIEKHCYNFFSENYNNIDSDYIYLPIQWTAYHLMNGYGQNVQPLIDLYSQIIDQLSDQKFFTVVQYDGGTLVELPNCRVFAASGSFSSPIGKNSTYEPIPLLCDPHPVIENNNKQYKVIFCGRRTHDLRETMFEVLSSIEGYNLYDTSSASISQEDVDTFRTLLSNSIFGLCPRGYGPASFRFYETIQMGCIPIYITDEVWLPFNQYINWQKLCLIISPDEIDQIPSKVDQLIETGEYKTMLEYGRDCYNNYLSWDGAVRTIAKIISN